MGNLQKKRAKSEKRKFGARGNELFSVVLFLRARTRLVSEGGGWRGRGKGRKEVLRGEEWGLHFSVDLMVYR